MHTIGIDQRGGVYHNLGKHPRKALLGKLGASKANKMYRDQKQGEPIHVGYVIGPLWVEIFQLIRWEGTQR